MPAHAHRQRQLPDVRHKTRRRRPRSRQPRADPRAGGEKEGASGALRIEAKNTEVIRFGFWVVETAVLCQTRQQAAGSIGRAAVVMLIYIKLRVFSSLCKCPLRWFQLEWERDVSLICSSILTAADHLFCCWQNSNMATASIIIYIHVYFNWENKIHYNADSVSLDRDTQQ